MKLDEFDLKIIEALQENGRLSNMEVSEIVNLSHSSCSRRISRLEKEGVIRGYRALTDRRMLGYSVRAYCGVVRSADTPWQELADSLALIDSVIGVYAVSGTVDIMLEIVAKDMDHFSDVVLKEISDTKGVATTRSSFVLKEVKSMF